MRTVTHVAGPAVKISGRIIQRCPVCGEVLADSKNTAAPLNADGSDPSFPTWADGDLVQIEPGDGVTRTSAVGSFFRSEELPDDFCLALVE